MRRTVDGYQRVARAGVGTPSPSSCRAIAALLSANAETPMIRTHVSTGANRPTTPRRWWSASRVQAAITSRSQVTNR